MDVLEHHVRPQVGAVVDVAGPRQLGPVGLVLDGAGANDPHIAALDFRIGGDVPHTGHHIVPAFFGNYHGALRAGDGVFCQQISHIHTSLNSR